MSDREEIQHRIDIMQAWLDGEVVEYRQADNLPWFDCDGWFDFYTDGQEYRIKPLEVRERKKIV